MENLTDITRSKICKYSRGIHTISSISYTYEDTTGFLNVDIFKTPVEEDPRLTVVHDMRTSMHPFKRNTGQRRGNVRMPMKLGY